MDVMDDIARAVLYEGYLLWPYSRSALKNQRRWAMGALHAPAVPGSASPDGPGERTRAQTQCLLETPPGGAVTLEVRARFLQLVDRQLLRQGKPVDELRVNGTLHQSWEEAAERDIVVRERLAVDGDFTGDFAVTRPLRVPGGTHHEPLGSDGTAVIRRSWRPVEGDIEIEARTEPAPGGGGGLLRLTVRLANTTDVRAEPDTAARRRMASAHLGLRVAGGGRFVSAMDPPPHLRQLAAGCVNDGLWPVLVGAQGATDAMLAAPVVLYDWPQVAPESPGDLFDATEIDQMLVLNVLSMTAEEQEQMAAADPRAREILERCTALSDDQRARLHGTLRDAVRETW